MSYLTEQDIVEIQNSVRLLSINEMDDILHYSFDSHISEYNEFLTIARHFYDLSISKSFLLLHRKTDGLLAYMTLLADSIKLTNEEKELHSIGNVPYASIPALKVGKLAVYKELTREAQRKGYGSFLLEMARAFAFEMNEMGIACRFITINADIEYEPDTPQFYKKNGFVENLNNKRKNPKHTISMRKDIFEED